MTRFERGCRLNSNSAPAYRPLDPTAVCFLFDTALTQNPNPTFTGRSMQPLLPPPGFQENA
jgi:hypothetical protein